MPRAPDSANLENRIRKLREQFQITQDRLGELLGLNGDAIRNLENGRMKIAGPILHRLITAVGAEYSTEKKVWRLPASRIKCSPLTLEAWKQAAKPSNKQKRKDHHALSWRIAALLVYSKPQEYNVVFTKLSELLDTCLKEHPSPEAKEAFVKSAAKMNIRKIWKKDEAWEKTALADDEEFSVAEEKGLPTHPFPYPKSQILEVTREYKDFPSAEEILPSDVDGER
jgi:DNA-binding XRE family transcriptional regulator